MVSRTMSVNFSSFTINPRDDYNVSINQDKEISVKIIGLESEIDNITSEDLTVFVDTTEHELSESITSLPCYVRVTGDYPCWVVGKYDLKVKVESNN